MIESSIDSVLINFNSQTLWLLNTALAFVMFGIALDISVSDFKALYRAPRPIIAGFLSQFLVLPFLTFLVVFLLEPLPSFALGMMLVAACPGGNVSNFMTHLAQGNTALSVSLTALASLFAVILTPINLEIWGSLYEPTAGLLRGVDIDAFEMARLVALILGFPLLTGMLVRYNFPEFARKAAKGFKYLSLLFFIFLIGLALYDNWDVFSNYVWYVFWLVLLHNFLAICGGYGVGRLMGISRTDRRTIAIETGIQNSGLGLLLVFTFFDGLGGMAVLAAFWGIWHLVSGLILSYIWGLRVVAKNEVV